MACISYSLSVKLRKTKCQQLGPIRIGPFFEPERAALPQPSTKKR